MKDKQIRIAGLIFFWVLGCASQAHAEVYSAEQIADAIYKAEGGTKAKNPYGILSVPCGSEKECREICLNTIENNFSRWQNYGHKTHPDFITFLGSRYCPVSAHKLNKNWVKNVKSSLSKSK